MAVLADAEVDDAAVVEVVLGAEAAGGVVGVNCGTDTDSFISGGLGTGF